MNIKVICFNNMKLYSRSKKALFSILLIGSLILSPSLLQALTLLYDNFPGVIMSSSNWYIPTWVSPTSGTFVGQTQFICTPNPLPPVQDNNAIITVYTYNPTQTVAGGPSFYGYEVISNQSFTLAEGIDITVVAKMNTPTPGIVGGIFLYALKPGSTTLHDEIDFELLTNLPNEVQTNIYSDQPLGTGDPQFVSYASGSITDYHTYEIKWLPNEVSWFIDGALVRQVTSNVPAGPMNLYINMWVPGSDWPQAYSATLVPSSSPSSDQGYSMYVSSVDVQSLTPGAPTAVSCSYNSSGSTMLWAGAGGYAYLWTLDSSTNVNSLQTYGPYGGWTPVSYSYNPGGSTSTLLWTGSGGYACLWTLNSSNNSFMTQEIYGPYGGWTPVSYSYNPAGTTSTLAWAGSGGYACLWTLNSSNNSFMTQEIYGPYGGWTPVSYSYNPAGSTSTLLWAGPGGYVSIWTLNSSTNMTTGSPYYVNYGP